MNYGPDGNATFRMGRTSFWRTRLVNFITLPRHKNPSTKKIILFLLIFLFYFYCYCCLRVFFFCCSICLCVFVRFCFHVFYFTDDSWRHVTKQVIYTTCTYVCVCVCARFRGHENCETRAWSQWQNDMFGISFLTAVGGFNQVWYQDRDTYIENRKILK